MSETSPVGSQEPSAQKKHGSWFEAMAEAWGSALNRQADKVVARTSNLSENGDNPSDLALLSAETFRFQYMANGSHTALVSAGQALDTLARKQ